MKMSITRKEITLNDLHVSGELMWKPGEANEAFLDALTNSSAWKVLSERFDLSSPENLEIINDFLLAIAAPLLLPMAENALQKLSWAGGQCKYGDLTPRPSQTPVEEVPSETPVHRGQQLWSEYRQFSETHSMQECRARARTDIGFASFMRTNLQRESMGTESTQFLVAGKQPSRPDISDVTPELLAWANEFKRTPTEEVRKLRNPTINALGFQQYEANLNAAIAANLV
jgi:hypothetical protein